MSDSSPARVAAILDQILPPVGRTFTEIAAKLRFLATADATEFAVRLGSSVFLPAVTSTIGYASSLDHVGIAASGYTVGQRVCFVSSATLSEYILADTGTLPGASDDFAIIPSVAAGTKYWQLAAAFGFSPGYSAGLRQALFLNQTIIAGCFSGDGNALSNLPAAALSGALPAGVTIDAARLTSGIIPPARCGTYNVAPNSNYSFATDSFSGGVGGLITNSLTAARSYNLPPVANYPVGAFYIVYDAANVVTPTNTITLLRDGTDTINGATSITLSTTSGRIVLRSLGSGKWSGWADPYIASEVRLVLATTATNATTTFVNVPGMAFNIGANEVWQVEWHLVATGGTGGTKLQLTGPASPTLVRMTGLACWTSVSVHTVDNIAGFSTPSSVAVFTSAATLRGLYNAAIINGSTAGTVQLQFQSTGGATTISILSGSYMIARRIS